MSKKVFMLVANSVVNDPRVTRASKSLAKNGYSVAVGGIAANGQSTGKFTLADVDVYRWPPSLLKQGFNQGIKRYSKKSTISSLKSSSSKTKRPALLLRTLNGAGLFLAATTSLFHGFDTVQRFQPDVIHAHDLNTLLPAVLMARKCGARVIYDSHEIFSEVGSFAGFYRRSLRILEKRLLKNVDVVITVSEGIADLLAERYQIEHPYVVLNTPDVIPIRPVLRQDQPVNLVYHGGISQGRGLELLVHAFSLLPSSYPARLTIRGFGLLKPKLEAIVEATQSKNKIVFAEPVPMDQVVSAASEADIGVIPFLPVNLNNILAMPNKLFEYLAAGLGIWSTADLVEVKRMVHHYKCGGTYNLNEPENVMQQLVQFIDSTTIADLRRNAYKATINRFNWSKQEEILYEIYEQI